MLHVAVPFSATRVVSSVRLSTASEPGSAFSTWTITPVVWRSAGVTSGDKETLGSEVGAGSGCSAAAVVADAVGIESKGPEAIAGATPKPVIATAGARRSFFTRRPFREEQSET